ISACTSVATTTAGPTAGTSPTTSVATQSAQPMTLQILGAASLKGALDKVKIAYEGSHPGTTISFSTDSSAALETQIEQGAPADVFLSADTVNPNKLVDRGFASGQPVVFARNLLTIIVPIGNPAHVTGPADLARPGVRV